MVKSKVVIGVKQGGGAPPGYEWNAWYIESVHKETLVKFGELGRDAMVENVKLLAKTKEPQRSELVDVRDIQDFFEIRDKGSVYGKVNARLFFGLDKTRRVIVILGAAKKQNNGPTPIGDRKRMERRWRKYKNSEFKTP